METRTVLTHLQTTLQRLITMREQIMLDRRMKRPEQQVQLNQLLQEQAAISFAIGLIDQRQQYYPPKGEGEEEEQKDG